MSKPRYAHLDRYSDWVAAAHRAHPLFPRAKPGRATRRRLLRALDFEPHPPMPRAPRVEQRWTADGVDGERVTWSVGYGPRTEAFMLRPAGVRGPLPGVVALHDHGGYKYFGKEKIADGPEGPQPAIVPIRQECYAGRAFANALAKRGFAVLVPDVFIWGSRKFSLAAMTGATRLPRPDIDENDPRPTLEAAEAYNDVARRHEDCVERYAALMGSSIAGVMTYEDRVAAAYLKARRDVAPGGVACVGLSGGGMRSCWLNAVCDDIRAAVIVGMMCTWEGLLNQNVRLHAWGFFPHGISTFADWSDIAACRAPQPLLVMNNHSDPLFSPAGMRAAHRRMQRHYREAGAAGQYSGRFYDGPHKFDIQMQDEAFAWLEQHMGSA